MKSLKLLDSGIIVTVTRNDKCTRSARDASYSLRTEENGGSTASKQNYMHRMLESIGLVDGNIITEKHRLQAQSEFRH